MSGKEAALLSPPPLRTARMVGWAAGELLDRALFQQPPSKLTMSLSISVSFPVIYAVFTDDTQYGFGVSHLAYLSILVIRSPISLRRVLGFPQLRLLWRFRRHRTRVP